MNFFQSLFLVVVLCLFFGCGNMCDVCNTELVDGKCPNGHKQVPNTRSEWMDQGILGDSAQEPDGEVDKPSEDGEVDKPSEDGEVDKPSAPRDRPGGEVDK